MRKFIFSLLILLCAGGGAECYGQLNKYYFYWVGRSYMMDDKYEAAIETLNTLLRVDRNAHEAYFLRGVAKFNLDDLLGAEQDFTIAIEKNPVYTMAYNARAITRSRLGNYDDALKDFQEAIDLRPDLPGPYYSRGVTYLLGQQFDKAVADFDRYIRQENKVADAYLSRGTAYLHMKDTVRTYNEYDLAIRTNREDPRGYYQRGTLYSMQERYDEALADFNKSIECDSSFIPSYFNRSIIYSHINKPVLSLGDLDKVLELDSMYVPAYFNRALVRTQIGDYNRAMEDYDRVALYSPNNVLVYYNRAALHAQLGNIQAAVDDYSKAIELYPDFANAYLYRSDLRYYLRDTRGARSDKNIADKKIAEYRSKLNDSTFSVYADTSRNFNRLLSFDNKFAAARLGGSDSHDDNISLQPLFKFSFVRPDSLQAPPRIYVVEKLDLFRREVGNPLLAFTARESNIDADSLIAMDGELEREINAGGDDWLKLFERGITQSLIKQYTSSVGSYSAAIEKNPTNPFLYINRSTTRSEMIDFISSIDNSYQRISIDRDPANRLKNTTTRSYSYDEAISDLNKAAKLFPEFAYTYYNRANLKALSGQLPEAFDDYSQAIALNPDLAEAYFNRGLIQIYMKDTRKGLLDISKAGELGIRDAYTVLKRYSPAAE